MVRNKPIRSFLVAATLALPASAAALSMVLPTGLGSYTIDVTSFKEARFQTILRQQYDYSCGSAAVASLLTFHYRDPRTEEEVFRAMWELGDQQKIRQQGFSLLDIKRYLDGNGYQSDGFRLKLDRLAQVGVPAITLINNGGYMHFVVIKGVSGREVLLGDPVLGVRVVARDKFEEMWQGGIVFLIKNKADVARATFNRDAEWETVASAPLGLGKAMSTGSLADFNLLLPARSDF